MSGIRRKMLIKHQPSIRRVSLTGVHNQLRGKNHRHVCTNERCRLLYEDNCQQPETNQLCRPCRGQRRAWVYSDGRAAFDPRPCCRGNTALLTEPDDLLKYECAGPGPWFQCQTCFRTHGHSCLDLDLYNRPLAVTNQEGTS